MRRLVPLLVLLLAATLLATCGPRDPCRRLAERDCERHGEDSRACRDARELAASADPFLTEICRQVLEGAPKKR